MDTIERLQAIGGVVRFSLGMLVATPGVMDLMPEHQQELLRCLGRHMSGDWGDLDRHDRRANESALRSGSRLLSSYKLADGTKVWIITEGANENGHRYATTMLLPEEY